MFVVELAGVQAVVELAEEFVEQVPHADGMHAWLTYKFPIIENNAVVLVSIVIATSFRLIGMLRSQFMDKRVECRRRREPRGPFSGVAGQFSGRPGASPAG